VQTRSSRRAVWDSLLDPGMLSLLVVEPNFLPVWALYRYIGFMEENGLSSITYEVAFWGKVAVPLVILAMISLAVPLLFGSLRSVGVGQRVFVGVLIGIVFYVLNKGFSQLAVVYPVSPVVAAFLPGTLCFIGALWLFGRAR
jgi:lipopolysaccharide export system permease protein